MVGAAKFFHTVIILILDIKKLGSSHEGRAIWMVKIGRGAAGELTPRSQNSSLISAFSKFTEEKTAKELTEGLTTSS